MPDAPPPILGLHHVTAITADAQANHDFYAGVLGLRLVKKTVNFDDPTSYHLYYGDETGSPGSIVTFFAMPGLPRGWAGWPQVAGVELAVARARLDDWRDHLRSNGIAFTEHPWLDGTVLDFADPDGLNVEVVGRDVPDSGATTRPNGLAPTRLDTAELNLGHVGETTLDFLRVQLGLTADVDGQPGLPFAGSDRNQYVSLNYLPDAARGRPGAGTVHHVAFRVATDADQLALRERLLSAGLNVSPVMDRTYFRSIYFHEPGGILLEVATDGPGFAVDEPAGSLGERLCLPPALEPRRAEIEAGLPPLVP